VFFFSVKGSSNLRPAPISQLSITPENCDTGRGIKNYKNRQLMLVLNQQQ